MRVAWQCGASAKIRNDATAQKNPAFGGANRFPGFVATLARCPASRCAPRLPGKPICRHQIDTIWPHSALRVRGRGVGWLLGRAVTPRHPGPLVSLRPPCGAVCSRVGCQGGCQAPPTLFGGSGWPRWRGLGDFPWHYASSLGMTHPGPWGAKHPPCRAPGERPNSRGQTRWGERGPPPNRAWGSPDARFRVVIGSPPVSIGRSRPLLGFG